MRHSHPERPPPAASPCWPPWPSPAAAAAGTASAAAATAAAADGTHSHLPAGGHLHRQLGQQQRPHLPGRLPDGGRHRLRRLRPAGGGSAGDRRRRGHGQEIRVRGRLHKPVRLRHRRQRLPARHADAHHRPAEAPAASHATVAAVTLGGNTFVYVAGNAADAVYGYSVAADGTLTAVAAPGAAGETPYSLTIDASGKYLYVGGSGGSIGTSQGIGTLTSTVTGYIMNQINGTLTPVEITVAGSIGGLVLMVADPAAGVIYADDVGAGDLYPFQINASTGMLKQGTEISNSFNVRGLTTNPAGRYLLHGQRHGGQRDRSTPSARAAPSAPRSPRRR